MIYDEILDEYTCQNGKKFKVVGHTTRKAKSGTTDVACYYIKS